LANRAYFIGTSGWSYLSFRGIFYPPELKSKDWLAFYAQYFNTVELNVTFYRTPKATTFQKWYEETPQGFVFSLKAPKVITHIKKLKDIEDSLKEFLKSFKPLKEKAKVLLFQFPPSLKYERGLCEAFLKLLPTEEFKIVVEIRNQSFHDPEWADLLREYGICLCFSDCGKRYPSWYEVKTADFLYFRMHGSKELYVSNYEEEELVALKNKIEAYNPSEAYIYFDNTALGYAVANALRLKELCQSELRIT